MENICQTGFYHLSKINCSLVKEEVKKVALLTGLRQLKKPPAPSNGISFLFNFVPKSKLPTREFERK